MLNLPPTPGRKIKQHTVHNELPSGAVLIDKNASDFNLAERMANAETQPTNENEETNSISGELNNNNAMDEDHDNVSINSDYIIESIAINPKAFFP